MTERTAAEILLAQLDHEVEELRHGRTWNFDWAVTLIEKVCTRWWLRRMSRPLTKPDGKAQEERRAERAYKLSLMSAQITQASGGNVDGIAMHIQLLGQTCDMNALWGAIIEAGILTPEMRQQYLDASIDGMLDRVKAQAAEIKVANKVPRRMDG